MSATEQDSVDHYLTEFLKERLPKLGLDFETYGPYLMTNGDDEENSSDPSEDDEDELDSVVELLRASSETHTDDEDAWVEFKKELQAIQAYHRRHLAQIEQERRQAHLQQAQEQLHQEILLAQQQQPTESKVRKELDAQKQALVDRYEYDDSELYDEAGDLISDTTTSTKNIDQSASELQPKTTKLAAQEQSKQQAQKQRQQHTSSKKEERERTKAAKSEKERLKEERRKRATKGERRR